MNILTILKFAGIIVSGALGILGTATKTHEEVELPPLEEGGLPRKVKRLTHWGRWALCLTIAGFVTALGSQIVESVKKQHEDAESRARTEDQIKQANEVLKRLEQQGQQSSTILINVEQQGVIAKQSLDTLSVQSMQTRVLLTNVESQGVLSRQTLDTLSTQSVQTHFVLAELKHQNSLVAESQNQAQQQVEAANLSLGYIERLLTRLDSIEMSVVYELPTNSPFAATLLIYIAPRSQMAQLAATNYFFRIALLNSVANSEQALGVTNLAIDKSMGLPPPTLFKIPEDGDFQPKPPAPRPIVFTDLSEKSTSGIRLAGSTNLYPITSDPSISDYYFIPSYAEPFHLNNIVGAIELTNYTQPVQVLIVNDHDGLFFSLAQYDIPGVRHQYAGTNLLTHILVASLTNEFWKATVGSNGRAAWAGWTNSISTLITSDIRLEFFQTKSFTPDLIIDGPWKVINASLLFSPNSSKLLLSLDFTSSGNNWSKTKKIQSIPDLAETRLHIFSGFSSKMRVPNKNLVQQISLKFGNSDIMLTNFNPVLEGPLRFLETTLPSQTNFFSEQDIK